MMDIYDEFNDKIASKHKIMMFKSKVCQALFLSISFFVSVEGACFWDWIDGWQVLKGIMLFVVHFAVQIFVLSFTLPVFQHHLK